MAPTNSLCCFKYPMKIVSLLFILILFACFKHFSRSISINITKIRLPLRIFGRKLSGFGQQDLHPVSLRWRSDLRRLIRLKTTAFLATNKQLLRWAPVFWTNFIFRMWAKSTQCATLMLSNWLLLSWRKMAWTRIT